MNTHGDSPQRGRKLGFVLLSNSANPAPSTRISVLNVIPLLQEHGFACEILFDPDTGNETPVLDEAIPGLLAAKCDIVVFQKVYGDSVLRAVRALREAGVRTLYSVCDLVKEEMVAETDACAAVTEYLRQLYPKSLQEKISVVHDGIERPEACRAKLSAVRRRGEPLRAVLVTSEAFRRIPILEVPPPGYTVTILGRVGPVVGRGRRLGEGLRTIATAASFRDAGWALRAAIHPRLERVAWSLEGSYAAMASADIGIIPADYQSGLQPETAVPWWQVKSENRLTMKMAIGLPVVASPVPSYEGVLVHGVTGFFAGSRRDWLTCMDRLRDPDLRAEMGRAARTAVLERFSKERQAQRLIGLINRTLGLVASPIDKLDSSGGSRAP